MAGPRAIARYFQVGFSFVIEQLRRIPGARQVERRAAWIALGLVFAAVVALAVWGAQRSPQRVSIADLVAGGLSHLQTWIIVSSDLREEGSSPPRYRYAMTDPGLPDAKLMVTSEVELPVGEATVSGILVGGTSGAQPGFGWLGQLRADSELAHEADPPWVAIALVVLAAFIAVAVRTTYPVFFAREVTPLSEPRQATLTVRVMEGSHGSGKDAVRGALSVGPGAPVELRTPGRESQVLRLHSAHSSVQVGELRWLSDSVPALQLSPATGELTLTFASNNDRDAAYSVIVGDLSRRD